MKFILALLATTATAFPGVLEEVTKMKARSPLMKRADNASQAFSQSQTNCGPRPCFIFDPQEQFVSNTGEHAFKAPSDTDLRGPCPGLNAAANHGYIPHDGALHIEDTADGLFAAYGLDKTLSRALAVYAITMVGDPLTMRWSIGGELPGNTPLTQGQGISNAHNKYEADTSFSRFDKYLNNGKGYIMDVSKFVTAYEYGMAEDSYTMDTFRQMTGRIQHNSIVTNPYYFSPAFAGTLVAPEAHNFVVNFMSNHSAEQPDGYLNGAMLKQFFSVTGDYPNFVHKAGYESIPDNWYRRAGSNPYTTEFLVADLVVGFLAYPDTFRLGGNTNGVNTYRGLDVATLTGGQYDMAGLFEGNNLGCFIFQSQNIGIPDFLDGSVTDLALVRNMLETYAGPAIASLGCENLREYEPTAYDQFPGSKI